MGRITGPELERIERVNSVLAWLGRWLCVSVGFLIIVIIMVVIVVFVAVVLILFVVLFVVVVAVSVFSNVGMSFGLRPVLVA